MKLNSNLSIVLACCFLLGCQSASTSQSVDHLLPDESTSQVAPTSVEANLNPQDAQSWSPEEGVDALLSRAIVQSPTVRQAYQAWQVALQRVPQVSALPDPWLSLTGYVQSVETRSGPMDARIGYTQKLPWPGKLDAAGDLASAQAEVARNQIEVARLGIRRLFLRNWAERVYLRKAEEITAAQVALLEHIEEVSLRLYESSRVPQADVLRAQVERLEMVDRLDTMVQNGVTVVSVLESALGAPIDSATSWETIEFYPFPQLANESVLQQRLMTSAPIMQQLQARLLVSQQAQQVADFESKPDWSIGADWTWIGNGNVTLPDAGDDAVSLSLAVELPLGRGRIDGARRQALASRRFVVAQIEDHQWKLLSELQQALSAYEDALRRIDLFEQRMLPLSLQTYETTLAAYQSGQAGFQDMLDAARVMLEFRLSSARASADAALAIADLHGLLTEELLLAENLER